MGFGGGACQGGEVVIGLAGSPGDKSPGSRRKPAKAGWFVSPPGALAISPPRLRAGGEMANGIIGWRVRRGMNHPAPCACGTGQAGRKHDRMLQQPCQESLSAKVENRFSGHQRGWPLHCFLRVDGRAGSPTYSLEAHPVYGWAGKTANGIIGWAGSAGNGG